MRLSAAPERPTAGPTATPNASPAPSGRQSVRRRAERKLLERVFARCHAAIVVACSHSTLPPSFLGALVANESGGNARAARFEPAVYRHLRGVADGKAQLYSGIHAADLDAEFDEMLHPKADAFHQRSLTPEFRDRHSPELAALEDEALRELATSWGFTQIMGYHMVGRSGTVRDLLDAGFHFRVAVELLNEFAQEFALDPSLEFEPLFRCWNTGSPYGVTFAPDYVRKGIERIEIYREVAGEEAQPEPSLDFRSGR